MATYYPRFINGSISQVRYKVGESKAICCIHQHFNSSIRKSANYTLTMVKSGDTASRLWAYTLASIQSQKLGIKNSGVKQLRWYSQLGKGDRGYPLVRGYNCPVLVNEPCFISNPRGLEIAKSPTSQQMIAQVIVDSIHSHFPRGGEVALVIGHLHKGTRDKGARAYDKSGWEGDYARDVLTNVYALLRNTFTTKQRMVMKDMSDDYRTEHRLGGAVDNKTDFWLNLMNDSEKDITVTCHLVFKEQGMHKQWNVDLPSYTTMNPGILINDQIRRFELNYEGAVTVTVKHEVDELEKVRFVAWKDVRVKEG